jgi:hypothetical protein
MVNVLREFILESQTVDSLLLSLILVFLSVISSFSNDNFSAIFVLDMNRVRKILGGSLTVSRWVLKVKVALCLLVDLDLKVLQLLFKNFVFVSSLL